MPDPERSFSWSAISAFKWSKEQWYIKYVIHQKCTYDNVLKKTVAHCHVAGFADPECPVVKKTIQLAFGSWVDLKLQKDKKFMPKLPRLPELQKEIRIEFHGIPLIGIFDNYRPLTKKKNAAIRDSKTGEKPWTQKRADETGQLTNYGLLLWLSEKVRPEDVDFGIDWMPTHIKDGKVDFIKKGDVVPFETRRSMRQILDFGNEILDIYSQMQLYAKNHDIYVPHVRVKKPLSKFLK